MCTYILTHTRTHIQIYIYVNTYTLNTYKYICIHKYTYIYVYTYMYTYITHVKDRKRSISTWLTKSGWCEMTRTAPLKDLMAATSALTVSLSRKFVGSSSAMRCGRFQHAAASTFIHTHTHTHTHTHICIPHETCTPPDRSVKGRVVGRCRHQNSLSLSLSRSHSLSLSLSLSL